MELTFPGRRTEIIRDVCQQGIPGRDGKDGTPGLDGEKVNHTFALYEFGLHSSEEQTVASVELVSLLCVCVCVRRAMLDVMVSSEKKGQTDFL